MLLVKAEALLTFSVLYASIKSWKSMAKKITGNIFRIRRALVESSMKYLTGAISLPAASSRPAEETINAIAVSQAIGMVDPL